MPQLPSPPPHARARRARRPRRVLLLVESSRSSGRALLRGIADYARLHGPWAFLWEPSGLERPRPRPHPRDEAADGVIARDTRRLDASRARRAPAVLIEHDQTDQPGFPGVITDSATIGRLAAEHLLDLGLAAFAYCGLPRKPWSRLRGEAFAKRLSAAGSKVDFFPHHRAAPGTEAERQRLVAWLRSLPKPVGLMACNDDRAIEVIESCKIAGIPVPDAIAVVGVDNDELVCDLADPPLTSVAPNFHRAGFECARLLDRLMSGRPAPRRGPVVRASHVVARLSTDTLAIDDPHLAKALRLIRRHAGRPLSVPEVASASGLCRRSLEIRFRARLGRTILQEIRRARVALIRATLVETDLSVSQIALSLGFGGGEHISRYFRRETRLSPLDYRRRHSPRFRA